MCVCGEETLWLLCGGKYKFLLRSAWIVLAVTTLIDISAIIAYWQLAPKSIDSKPGLKLSLLLLVAVLFLYFFAVLLSCFVIIKLSPRKLESSRVPRNRNRAENGPAAICQPLPQSSISYSDGFRHVLPNNVPPLPCGNSQRRTGITEVQERQNRSTSTGQNATRSSTGNRNCHTPEDLNLNDRHSKKLTSSQSNVQMAKVDVPEIIITGPDDPVPIYENTKAQTCQFSAMIQSNSSSRASTDVTFLRKTTDLTYNYLYRSNISPPSAIEKSNVKMSMHQAEIYSRNTTTNFTDRPVSSASESYVNRSVAYQCYKEQMSMHQAKIDSRSTNTNLSVKPAFSRSEDYLNRSDTNQRYADERAPLEMSLQQAKIDSRSTNISSTVKPVSTRSESYINRSGANSCYADRGDTLEMSMHQAKIDSRSTNSCVNIKAVSTRSESYINRSGANSCYADVRDTLEMSLHQAKIDSRSTNSCKNSKPVSFRSESYVKKSDATPRDADVRDTLETTMHIAKMDSRSTNSNSTIRSDVSSESHAAGSWIPEQFRCPSTTVTRNTDSFIVKSQPVIDQYRRYTVDRLPLSPNRETQLLFKAVERSKDLFEQPSI